ncbi:unnamed protein product, partial [Urochloa humidicola]
MAKAHILVLPMPAQGHVTPLMQLSHRLVEHGFEVTFVNIEALHELVVGALQAAGGTSALPGIHLAAISGGVEDDDECKDVSKLVDAYPWNMPRNLERLVAKMEAVGRPKVKWLISDVCAWWSFDVAKSFGIRVASFLPASAAGLAISLKIPKLTEDGLINSKVWPEREETFQLVPGVPPLHTSNLPWNHAGAGEEQPILFELFRRMERLSTLSEMVVCNSFHEAEAGAFKLLPNVLPIGPLSSDAEFRKPVGQFLPEDTRCLRWLDAQPDNSVMYVAFGSSRIFDPCQFNELALGLELTGRPFLLVVRPEFTTGELSKAWFDEFQAGVAGKGMLVSWCPQQQVLAHRAVACFVSHCGWNSTMEGVRNGVPLVCWPYFTDQFLNQSYICNVWRTGLAVSRNADGIVTKEELRSKVEQVVGDAEIRERARLFKDAAWQSVSEGGSSNDNFKKLVS